MPSRAPDLAITLHATGLESGTSPGAGNQSADVDDRCLPVISGRRDPHPRQTKGDHGRGPHGCPFAKHVKTDILQLPGRGTSSAVERQRDADFGRNYLGFQFLLLYKHPGAFGDRKINMDGAAFIWIFGKEGSESEIRRGLPEVFPRLWRYALVLTGNRDQANDLAQATCLRAIEKAAGYNAGTNLTGWLFRMAQRIWLNELRASAVRRGAGLLSVEDIDIPDAQPDAETNYFVREVLLSVYALPEAQRASVMLVYVEGFSYAEAAEILEVPIGTIMSRLAAARRKVGARLISENEGAG